MNRDIRAAWGRTGRLLAWAAALAGALVVAATPVRAQDMTEDEAFEMGMEALTRKGFDKYAAILRLDGDQVEAARMLFDSYLDGVREMGKEMRAYMQDLQERAGEGDFTLYQTEMPRKMKEFQERNTKLEAGFFDDVRSLLRDDQAAQWPRLERFRRREELMQFGMVSGSAVDLIAIAEKLGLDPGGNPALAEQLETYELEIDKPLSRLKQATEDMQERAMDAMSEMDPTNPQAMMDKYNKMMEEILGHARQVRDVNRQYARLILPTLGGQDAGRFDAEFKRRSFPRVYRPSHAARALDAAEKFADLTDDQRQRLADVRAAYERDAAPANEKWASAIEARENQAGGGWMQMMWEGMGDSDDPVAQARKARRELDNQTRERIAAILTEAQRARLPERKAEPDNPWADFQAMQEDDEEDDD